MEHKMKLIKVFAKIEPRIFRHTVLAGVFLASMAVLSLGVPRADPSLTYGRSKQGKQGWQPLCNVSEPRSDICDMHGDVRIHGNSSSIIFITTKRNESYRIRPYARKGDEIAMGGVRQVFVKSNEAAPLCNVINHSIPAIVFSVSGYTGNLFHDFTDVLIPLFLTAHEFDGEVQFLVTNFNLWWIHKFQRVLSTLSRYEVIDFDKDESVRCFNHVIVGLRCHKELSIDPTRSPNGYSMVDFTRFIRNAYSLDRGKPITIGEEKGKKPRLLVISRKRTRAFVNVDDIVHMAQELGYEVVIAEANATSNMTKFAETVNTCDVLMGVHGAGLTNLVFLPTNGVLIQIVPWGGLKWIAMYDFGHPAKDMKVKYLQYEISPEESTLIEKYPRDHPVFKDPFSYHKKGFKFMRNTFMVNQNVRLDARRFRAVLLEALKLLSY